MAHHSKAALAVATASLALLSWQQAGARPQPRGSSPQAPPAGPQQPQVDRKADQLLRQMSEYLTGLRSFSVKVDHATEVVLKSGQKIEFGAAADVAVERPNHVRSDRKGQLATVTLYYDGRTVTIYGQKHNFYATAKAPPTIDGTIDFLRDQLDVDIPAADLLTSDPYRVLMEDVVSGIYVGKAEVRGVSCHHLAFRGHATDWQIWIEDSMNPLPHKLVVTTKDVKSMPEFTVELHDWNVDDRMPAGFFTFVPPKGAERIDFLGLAGLPGREGQQGNGPKGPPERKK